MLNRSFYLGLVSQVCEISYKLNSLLMSISELNVFVEYHNIHMSQKCEISYKILATVLKTF